MAMRFYSQAVDESGVTR
ncbi:hypothetical protein [Escherichia coli]